MTEPRIWDCVTYFDEIDHLQARFEMLDSLVAGHIVCEGTHTHQGDEHHPRAAGSPWLPDNAIMCLADLSGYTEPWDREHAQRDFIGHYVNAMLLDGEVFEPDDILVVCDVDEHLNPEVIPLLPDATERGPIALGMRMLFYGLDWELVVPGVPQMPAWMHGRALRVRDLPRSLSALREGPVDRLMVGAGWHVSYTGGPERRAAKLRAFAHAEKNNPADHALIAAAHETGVGPNGETLTRVADHTGIPEALVRRFG